MTFEQAFRKIKAKFVEADVTKLSNEFAVQVNMTDEDCGGAFYIQFTDGKLFVEPYDYRDNSADVTLKRLDLNKILDGKLTVEKALESGKLYIKGNSEDFKAAASCVKIPEKKTAVKKAAPKKTATTAKKTASAKADSKTKTAAKTEKKKTTK